MRRRAVLLVVLAAAVPACSDGGPELTLRTDDTVITSATTEPPTTAAITTAPASTTTVAPVSSAPTEPAEPPADWMAVTGNLAGLPSECGNMSSVFVVPDRDVVIAGIALQGLWASVDGSTTWSPLGQGPGSSSIINRPTSMVFDPAQPDRWWESGMYAGGGVYRSDDAGATFDQLGDVIHSDLVSVDLTDPDRRTLLSGVHEQSVVMRSADGGATWVDVSAGLPDGIGFASSPHVIDAQTHLLGTNEGPESGIFRTTDGGATWSRVFEGAVTGAPLVDADEGTITWLLRGGGGLVRTADGGLTWETLPAGGGIDSLADDLLELPDGRLATVGGGTVIVSEDGGQSWLPIGATLPYRPSGLAYSAFRDTFYVWRTDCSFETDNAIPPDAIMALPNATA